MMERCIPFTTPVGREVYKLRTGSIGNNQSIEEVSGVSLGNTGKNNNRLQSIFPHDEEERHIVFFLFIALFF